MRFELTEDQRMIQESVRRFAEAQVKPLAYEWDKNAAFPEDAVRGLAELGLMGMFVEEVNGGAALDLVAGAIALEEIARCDGSLALTVSSHNLLAIGHIARFGNEAQKARWLPSLASGQKLGAWALSERDAGSDVGAIATTAEKRDGGWVLNGAKSLVTLGARGDVFVVMARTAPVGEKRAITAFVVEKGAKGFSQTPVTDKLGMRASDTAHLTFHNVLVPGDQVLGEVNGGLADALALLATARVGVAAIAVGLARGALEEARAYALERHQFGRPISDNQAIQWMLADMATEVDAARLMVLAAAGAAARGDAPGALSSKAKIFATETAVRAGMKAVQIFGGNGYIREFPVERYLRDAKLLTLGEGTSEILRTVVARDVLRS